MSPSHLLAIIVRRFYRGVIILDAGWPLSDSIETSEFSFLKGTRKKIKLYLIDFFAFNLSNLVYVESNQQLEHCHKKFFISKRKLKVRFTGCLENASFSKPKGFENSTQSNYSNSNLVVFRGKYNPEAGLEFLSKVSEVLDSSVRLLVLCPNLPEKIKFPNSQNVTVIKDFLPDQELAFIISQANLMIGQLGQSSRLNRTIPHKFFESARYGVPYLTPVRKAIQEVASEDCIYFVSNEDERILAREILEILKDKELLANKGKKIKTLYDKKLSNSVLMKKFMEELMDSGSDDKFQKKQTLSSN